MEMKSPLISQMNFWKFSDLQASTELACSISANKNVDREKLMQDVLSKYAAMFENSVSMKLGTRNGAVFSRFEFYN